ncbi:MAG: hypothetical protein NUV91_01855 [Candidatus Omnitrophica bacterium]|nr:hypothetical protein [Candidatus Omnitrophota bacterium]
MMEWIIEVLGWLGTFLIIWAYYLISSNKLDSANRTYQLLNLIGAIALGVNVFYKQAWSAFTLEIIWGAIAILALMRNRK